ncbi:MAG: hypothetical protein KF773_25190 [Deltaproteobacteria bacterium]|nr:hypothetical protein [Deltaproteobacteria bacterium]MCW5806912.1 hypothetical protein [Deltaproteobacteria bacterium]
MRLILATAVAVALVGCGGKKDDAPKGSGGGSSGSAGKPVEPEKPVSCPPGSAVVDGKCSALITPAKVEAVAQQQSRVDELAQLLDKIDTVAAPVEVLDGLRQLDAWKTLALADDRLKAVDTTVATLGEAVKSLREFKGNLGQLSANLGNLRGELDRLLKSDGPTPKLAELQAQISSKVRTALEPYGGQAAATIQGALVPLEEKLTEASDYVIVGCAAARRMNAGDKAVALCKDVKDVFERGLKWIGDFKERPAKLFETVSSELQKQLDSLIDAEAKKLLDATQAKVNDALRLKP